MKGTLTGKSKIVIENGCLNVQNLKKLRLTVDQLEMRLRNQGAATVKTATLEPNGRLGYELNVDTKPLTVGEFKRLLNIYLPKSFGGANKTTETSSANGDIFEEIDQNKTKNHPDYLN